MLLVHGLWTNRAIMLYLARTLAGQGFAIQFGDDLGADEETALVAGNDRPLIVSRFPAAIKSFYMQPDPEDAEVVLGLDMLAPEGYGEIIGGGERASNLDYLIEQLKHHGLDQATFEWYLDLRRYGSVPHAGFGLGFERMLMFVTGMANIRDVIPFARTPGHCEF